MLMAVKNQCRVILLSVKYNLMREMTNRVSFLTNVSFMVLNNATFIIQWMLLFHLKKDIGGYELSDVMLLWGIAAATYGLSHIFFQRAYYLSDLITNGKLDSFMVQPKNVLLSVISSATNSSAIGDLIYGYLIILLLRCTLLQFFLFTVLTVLGALILTAFAVITGSISFWIVRGDLFAENLNNTVINFTTYPEGIFKNVVRILLYSLVPVGFVAYLPLHIMLEFKLMYFIAMLTFTLFLCLLAFLLFYRGLRRYSSSSLMSARI